jgi:hypothetical protein
MSAAAIDPQALPTFILRMEEGICDLDRWAEAVRDLGCCGCDVQVGGLYVMGKAMLESAKSVKDDWQYALTLAQATAGRRA